MKELGPIKYSVSGTTVYMWNIADAEGTPAFLEQSHHPHNGAFSSSDDAEAWAISYIKTTYNVE